MVNKRAQSRHNPCMSKLQHILTFSCEGKVDPKSMPIHVLFLYVMSCLPWQIIESVARLVLADSLVQKAHSPVSTFFHHFFYFKNLEVVKGKRYANRFPKKFLLFAHYLVSSCSLAQKHYSGAMLVFSCPAWDSMPNNRAHSPDSKHKMFKRHMFSSFGSCRRNI